MVRGSLQTRYPLTTSMVIDTDCIDSCKSNYHAITATTAPIYILLEYMKLDIIN
jgi:hypothetical protein